MYKTVHEAVVFAKEFRALVKDVTDVEIVVAPPFTALHAVAEAVRCVGTNHTGLDNIAFATKDQLLVVEDAGDLLHAQRDALDSGYLIDLFGKNNRAQKVTRWLAEGRDASALYDATTSLAL